MGCNICIQNETANSHLLENYGFSGNGFMNVTGLSVDDEINAVRNNGTLSPILKQAELQVPNVYGFTDKNSIDFKKAAANLFLKYYNDLKKKSYGDAMFVLQQQQNKVNIYINAVKTLGSGNAYVAPTDLTFGSDIKPATPIDVKPIKADTTAPMRQNIKKTIGAVRVKPNAITSINDEKKQITQQVQPHKNNTWAYVIIGVGTLVIIGGGIWFYRHKKIKVKK